MSVRERLRTGLERVPGGMTAARLMLRTLDVCLDYRVTGLAAEAAFFMLLSLPPLVLGLFGGLGYVTGWIGPDAVSRIVAEIQTYASQFLTEASITELLIPTVQDVLARGRPELVSVGFLLSLWSGSRALNVFIDTVSIMYGQKDVRGIIQLRALSLTLYTVGTLAGIVLLPIVLLGPSIIGALLPPQLDFLQYLYWPAVLLVSVLALTSLYHVSTPRRGPWVRDVPGAVLALTIWLLASYVVRASLEASLGGSTIYGPLSAPIVLLIWLYALALAILIGSGLNAATRTIWPVVLSDGEMSDVHWHRWSERAVLEVMVEDELAEGERGLAGGVRESGGARTTGGAGGVDGGPTANGGPPYGGATVKGAGGTDDEAGAKDDWAGAKGKPQDDRGGARGAEAVGTGQTSGPGRTGSPEDADAAVSRGRRRTD